LFLTTSCCITVVGLIIIAIKKISVKTSVQPIKNVLSISAQLAESISAPNRSKNEEQKDTFELQSVESHSRIINVAPIHLEEQRFESLEKIDTIQPMNSPTGSNDAENSESEETPEVPDQVICFNNRKFNPNLISSAGLTFLFVIAFILLGYIRFANIDEAFKAYIYYCLPTALPIVYFIVNPKHLIKAAMLLFDGL
jgi:hypothetical protein